MPRQPSKWTDTQPRAPLREVSDMLGQPLLSWQPSCELVSPSWDPSEGGKEMLLGGICGSQNMHLVAQHAGRQLSARRCRVACCTLGRRRRRPLRGVQQAAAPCHGEHPDDGSERGACFAVACGAGTARRQP